MQRPGDQSHFPPPNRVSTGSDELGRLDSLERELEATREELAVQMEILRATQARLDSEIANRKRIVAERDETVRQLRESEETFRKLFQYNLDSMTIIDVNTRKFIDANEQYTLHSGYRREEVIGKRAREMDPFYDPEEAARFIAELKTRLVVRNMEVRFKRNDGSAYPVLASAIILPLGGRPCCVTISRDISAIKETQRQLVEAREAALAASEAKSEFLSSMSHEIRTPLNAVLGMADLLWESHLDDEQRHYLEIMSANGSALLDQINDILDLARIESGRLRLERTEFDLRELIDNVGDMMGGRAGEKRLELAARIVPGVPTRLIGDPMRLRQILVNLIGNAIKFTDSGEIVLTAELAAPQAANRFAVLRFSVADTGIGIPPERMNEIFSPFTQADVSVSRKYGGTGLGLAIVKRLVELHKGNISVASTQDSGTTFIFTAEFDVQAPEAAASAASELAGARVLVVDDTSANRLILQETLTAQGARVTCVASGERALEEYRRARMTDDPYRLVLLDCRMPGMDGIDVARELKRPNGAMAAGNPLILMLTSDDLSTVRARARETGIEAYLVKPVKRAELLETIAQSLRRSDSAAAAGPSAFPQQKLAERPRRAPSNPASTLPRLLLAEDSPDNRFLVRAFLKDFPCTIDEVEDGIAALEKVKGGDYDLVLMDILMPKLDGYAATRAIREFERNSGRARIPIIALTASAMDDAVHKALEAGCTAHVAKPVKKPTLIAAIRDAMGETAAARDTVPPA